MLAADAFALTQLLQLASASLTETVTLAGVAMTAVGLLGVSVFELQAVAEDHRPARKLLGR